MESDRNKYLALFLCAATFLVLAWYGVTFSSSGAPDLDIKQQTFDSLDAIKNAKRKEIIRHFEEIGDTARAIQDDLVMRRSFERLQQEGNNSSLEYAVDERYASAYGDFYDILFVDSSGYVFHSIKKERDYHSNLFSHSPATSKLANALRRPGEEHFVEFNYYKPSEEAAAFFTVSLQKGESHLGWFVLQVSTNSTNQILVDREMMGRTGEVYLVNEESLMLSDSRFMEDSTILRQKVDTLAVREALLKKKGDSLIKDYRGVMVFSSYEKFDVFGATWIIIAEIDEDEVLTEFYKKHKNYFQGEFVRYLSAKGRQATGNQEEQLPRQRVDMNEFARGQAGKVLATYGVASCTAVAVYYPGKFSYLAHISPTDEIYQNSVLNKLFLGRHYHNFLAELLGRIEFFEVIPAERRHLRVAIVATHSQSLGKAVDAVLAHNLELANISFLYDPASGRADVVISAKGCRFDVQWVEEHRILAEDGLGVANLSEVLKKVIHYDA